LNSAATQERWHTRSARLARGSGSTNVIGLGAIRREAGNRWDKIRPGVIARLETLLRQRLGPADFFVPIDEADYLVVMPGSTPEDGQICCLRIAYELFTSLLGPCTIEQLDIAHAEAVDDDVLETRPFRIAELIEMAKKAELVLGPSPTDAAHLELHSLGVPSGQPALVTELSYLPIWDTQYQVIRAYVAATKGSRRFAGVETNGSNARELSRQLLTVLETSVRSLDAHLARGERFQLTIPVSYEVLSSQVARMEFICTCRQLSSSLRPYLAFRLDDIPVGVPQSRLVDLVATLAPFSGMLLAKVSARLSTYSIAAYQGIGLKAVGIGLNSVPESEQMREIDRLAAETKRLKLMAFLDDVSSLDILRYALERGINWLSGPAISSTVDDPGPMKRLSAVQLAGNFVYV